MDNTGEEIVWIFWFFWFPIVCLFVYFALLGRGARKSVWQANLALPLAFAWLLGLPVFATFARKAPLEVLSVLWLCFSVFVAPVAAIVLGHLALRRIKQAGGQLKGRARAICSLIFGYGWVGVMVVGMAVQGSDLYARYQQDKVFQATVAYNIESIERAKISWSAATGKGAGSLPTAEELAPFMPNNAFPKPMAGEAYAINPIGTSASCTVLERLPWRFWDLGGGHQIQIW